MKTYDDILNESIIALSFTELKDLGLIESFIIENGEVKIKVNDEQQEFMQQQPKKYIFAEAKPFSNC